MFDTLFICQRVSTSIFHMPEILERALTICREAVGVFFHQNNFFFISQMIYNDKLFRVVKNRERSQGWPEGSFFNSYYTEV